ncbi:RDD family protein [Micromonospora antibiotica]|uniref:RDD family protein n=1 Tax=Micromonospora antibiotica TaxID=2807623 RepID=A0ABS3V955_9ACTN|nr:RDD family protein [Micromonospora antibiotica]MBO4162144.1 RDD family protein [Micromonospora antibiotica]
MTQPPSYPTPPAGGPGPAAGGFAPPAGPHPQGYAVPPQPGPYAARPGGYPQPGPYAGLPGYPPPAPGTPPPGFPGMSPRGLPLASFGDRLLALLIDGLVLGAASMVFIVPAFIVFFQMVLPDLTTTADGTPTSDPFTNFLIPMLVLQGVIFVVAFAMSYVYQVEMMFKTGQTIGKRVMKIQVVPLDPVATLTRTAAAKRWAAYQIGGAIIPFFSYLDGLWQLWDKPWQQCLHDKFAGTIVVKVAG